MKEIIPIVQYAEAPRPFVFEERKPSEGQPSPDDPKFTRWVVENVQNKHHESGRINYLGVGYSSGPAITVSPYVPHYLQNVEEGIKPVVVALFNRGYLTYSSCMGHDNLEPRYVCVAFHSEEVREQITTLLSRKFKFLEKINLIRFTLVSSALNSKVNLNSKGALTSVERSSKKESSQREREYFNTLFYRRHESWCFLSIRIGMEVVFTGNSRKWSHYWWASLTNGWVRERITRALARIISDLPHYMG